MRQLLELLNLSTDFLKKKGIESPRRQVEEIFAHCLGISRTQLYMEFDRPLTDRELDPCRAQLARRGKGEPLGYILGHVPFLDCRIRVNPSVLIPRQETEILADKIVQEIKKESYQEKQFLDLCCGSGCLGISIKNVFPELHVVLSDLSADALQVANENGRDNEVSVEYLQGDLLEPFGERKADYVVCNPPYISEEEYADLSHEVKDYEPILALVAPEEGLQFYRRLSEGLPKILNDGAKVWLEMGHTQADSVLQIFSNSHWKERMVIEDWAGKKRFCALVYRKM